MPAAKIQGAALPVNEIDLRDIIIPKHHYVRGPILEESLCQK